MQNQISVLEKQLEMAKEKANVAEFEKSNHLVWIPF
jgi:hypothetical protein